MSYPAPYRSGSREWRTYRGVERAAERFGGKVIGFRDSALVIEWPDGTQEYRVTPESDGTRLDLQLKYDLEP